MTPPFQVLQFVFVGTNGFRFPICHYPTTGASPIFLNKEVWLIVDELQQWGFTVRQYNRMFVCGVFPEMHKATFIAT